MKVSKKILILSLVLIIAFFSFGCGTKQATEETETTIATVPVETEEVRQGTFTKTIILSGITQPENTVIVTPKGSDQLISLNVEVGDRVSAGQVIGVLDQSSVELQLRNAQVNHENAQNAYEDVLRNYERMKALYETGAIPKAEFEQIESGLKQAENALKQTENALQLQQLAYDNTLIKAPVSGVVAQVHTEKGAIVGPQSPIITIANIDTLEVNTSINELQVNKIKAGTEVEVLVPACDNQIFSGRIKTVSPTMDPAIKAYPVTITITNKDNIIKAGMYAEVELITDVAEDALIVPAEAVLSRNGDSHVFIVQDDKAVQVQVETGLSNSKEIQILKGLKPGDQVITRGNEDVVDGDLVTVVNRGDK